MRQEQPLYLGAILGVLMGLIIGWCDQSTNASQSLQQSLEQVVTSALIKWPKDMSMKLLGELQRTCSLAHLTSKERSALIRSLERELNSISSPPVDEMELELRIRDLCWRVQLFVQRRLMKSEDINKVCVQIQQLVQWAAKVLGEKTHGSNVAEIEKQLRPLVEDARKAALNPLNPGFKRLLTPSEFNQVMHSFLNLLPKLPSYKLLGLKGNEKAISEARMLLGQLILNATVKIPHDLEQLWQNVRAKRIGVRSHKGDEALQMSVDCLFSTSVLSYEAFWDILSALANFMSMTRNTSRRRH